MSEADATTPPAPARKARVPPADHPAFPRGDTAKLQPVAHAYFPDYRLLSVGTSLRGGVHRTVCCADALAWLRDRRLPRRCHVVCSPPDIGELKPITVADYTAWFVEAVRAHQVKSSQVKSPSGRPSGGAMRQVNSSQVTSPLAVPAADLVAWTDEAIGSF